MSGYIFDNLQRLDVELGQKAREHLIAMGGVVDLHTALWHVSD